MASMGDVGAGTGMLVVETIAKIRRAYFAQKKPIKAICRAFRLSRKVVRKVIRSEATEFHYERGRQPLPRIDPWREELDAMLLVNGGKPARERLTLIRIFEELRDLGYEGGYDLVRRYARAWRVALGAVDGCAPRDRRSPWLGSVATTSAGSVERCHNAGKLGRHRRPVRKA